MWLHFLTRHREYAGVYVEELNSRTESQNKFHLYLQGPQGDIQSRARGMALFFTCFHPGAFLVSTI